MTLPLGFIALTNAFDPKSPHTIYIRADAIEAVSLCKGQYGSTCTNVSVQSHNGGGYVVKETPEQVLSLIRGAAK